MRDVMVYPLIGSHMIIAGCLIATLLLSGTEVVDPDEEMREMLLEITCQEYYNSNSEMERMFLSMLIRELSDMEYVGTIMDEEQSKAMQEIIIRVYEKYDALLRLKKEKNYDYITDVDARFMCTD